MMRLVPMLVAVAMTAAVPAAAQTAPASQPSTQPYAGEQTREVSSLSKEDVAALLAGQGWGFAKPAELNGFPGPAHVLELADKLELTPIQRKRVELIHRRMHLRAKSTGARYISAEAAIDRVFKSGAAYDAGTLQTQLRDAERLRSELRRTHLQAHVETTTVLTEEQRKKYSQLRGYGAGGNHAGHQHQGHKH